MQDTIQTDFERQASARVWRWGWRVFAVTGWLMALAFGAKLIHERQRPVQAGAGSDTVYVAAKTVELIPGGVVLIYDVSADAAVNTTALKGRTR